METTDRVQKGLGRMTRVTNCPGSPRTAQFLAWEIPQTRTLSDIQILP